MRASLSPLGKVIAGTVEVTVSTSISYLSSYAIGYLFSGVFNAFKVRSVGLKGLHSTSVGSGKSWGAVGAYFSGFACLSKVVRGGVEDKWNQVCASCAAGACLNKAGGPESMAKGCLTYAGFTLLLDNLGGGGGGKDGDADGESDEADLTKI